MNPRALRALLSAAALAALAACGGGGGGGKLHVFVWADYLSDGLKADFTKETGIEIVEANFASNEELLAKLQISNAGYDLVCPSDYMVAKLAAQGLLLPLDHAKLSNLTHVAPEFRDGAWDPGMKHSVPFQWGVTGIGWLRSKRAAAPESWADVFDPARCGADRGAIGLLDDSREVIGGALLSFGFSPNSRDRGELAKARERLLALKPLVAAFDSEDFGAALARGQTRIAQGWTGTFANAAAESADVAFVVPKEGAFRYADTWAIPKGAPNRAAAERFIDYVLRPEVAAALVNERLYASCNAAARPLVEPGILAGTTYSDGRGADGKGPPLHHVENLPDDVLAVYDEIWKALKSE